MDTDVIKLASFNEKIKKYILLVVAFYLLISVAGIPLLLFWFLGVGQMISRRYYHSLSCQLTSRHLEYKKGVLFKVEKTIPLENIQDLTFIENPLLKYFGLRILKIETAGQSQPQGSADMKLVGIDELSDFKKSVLEQRSKLKEGNEISNKSVDSEMLVVLKDIKVLLKQHLNTK